MSFLYIEMRTWEHSRRAPQSPLCMYDPLLQVLDQVSSSTVLLTRNVIFSTRLNLLFRYNLQRSTSYISEQSSLERQSWYFRFHERKPSYRTASHRISQLRLPMGQIPPLFPSTPTLGLDGNLLRGSLPVRRCQLRAADHEAYGLCPWFCYRLLQSRSRQKSRPSYRISIRNCMELVYAQPIQAGPSHLPSFQCQPSAP